MRLAVILPTLGGGGMERMRLNMIRIWLRHGFEVDLVVSRREGALLDLVPPSVQVFEIAARHPLLFPWGLWRYIQLRKPTHLLSAGTDVNALTLLVTKCFWIKTPIAISFHIHLSQELSIQSRSQRLKTRCFIHLLRGLLARDTRIIAVSQGVADDLSRQLGLSDLRPEVIYNPTVTEETYELMNMHLAEQPIASGFPWILYVGRLVYAKGVDILLDAFDIVSRETNTHLVLLGDGPLKNELTSQIELRGLTERVHLKGFISNPLPWMRECDVLTLPSRNEGLPNVLIEALACGAQIVSTDCPSGPSEILAEGKYGQLVPMEDSRALASALLNCLSGKVHFPKNVLKERAQQFSAELAATHYEKVLSNTSEDMENHQKTT